MNKALCIEIGSSSVRLAELIKKKNSFEISNTFVFDTPDDATRDGKVRVADNVVAAIKNGIIESGMTATDVYFAVESTKILFKQVELPLVQKKLIKKMLETSFSDIFPVDELLYHISYVYKKAYEKNNKKMMLLDVFAVPNDLTESYYNLAVALNLNIKGLSPAGYHMVSLAPEIFEGRNVAMVNVGESISTLTVATDGNVVFSKTIPSGVRSVIQQIVNSPSTMDDIDVTGACELLYSQNILLQKVPTAPPPQGDEQAAIQTSTTMAVVNFAQEIESAFASFLSKENIHIKEFYLTGLGAGFAGISQLLTYIFGITVTVIQQYDRLKISQVAAEDTMLISCYPCASAVMSPVNLFTLEEQAGGDIAKKQQIDKICVYLAAIICFSAIGYGAYSWLQIETSRRDALDEKTRLEKRIDELRGLGVEKAFNDYTDASNKNKQISNIYLNTKSGNEDMTTFLIELEETLPSNARVTSLTLSPKDATISVTCNNKYTAANALNRLRNMKTGVSLQCDGVSEDDSDKTVSFTCKLSLVPTAERIAQQETPDGPAENEDEENPNLVNEPEEENNAENTSEETNTESEGTNNSPDEDVETEQGEGGN